MQDLMNIQLQLEDEMFNGGIRRFEADQQRQIASGNESDTAWNRRLLSELIAPMAEGIHAYKEEYEGKKGRAPRALAFLQCVENEVAAYITMKVVMDMLNTDVTLQAISMAVADRIEDQVRFSKLEGHAAKYFEKVKASLKASRTKSYRHAHNVCVVAEKSVAAKDGEFDRWEAWPKDTLLQIGTTLLEILENSVFFNGEPVFMRAMRAVAGKTVYYLQTSETVGEWISAFKDHVAQLSPAYAPCVVPPRPWVSPFNGGFHTEKVASRVRLVKGDREHVRKLTKKQMPKVYKAVNALQDTQWQVNKEVLAVVEEVIRLDLGYGKIPHFKPIIDKENKPSNPVPVEFQHLRGRELKEMLTADQWQAFINWKGECAKLYTAETKRGSKSAAVVRMVGQARKYSAFDAIYFVYALDSRSRVYAQSSTLSPQSNDLGKALLRFTEGQPLDTSEALKWFLISGANLWGWDKKTFDVRQANVWDAEFQDMCRDIAADPLTFTQWAKADEPYEFLAWCFEYARYLDALEDGTRDEFRTHLPVHQDGSCSGIQHYSAMLKDERGATAVNLKPGDAPQDIYGAVAQVVIAKNALYMDADEGLTFESGSLKLSGADLRAMANAWDMVGITRSLTKKPVMTLPYGSTRLTCRESVIDYIVDLEEKEAQKAAVEGRASNKVHPFEEGQALAPAMAYNYMTALIWPSISEVVKAPVVAMKMIRQLARFAAKRNEGLEYPLPTGFILKQKIMATEMLRVRTCLMGDIKMSLQVETDIVDETAMMGAAAPNFVHGHDASHLILTVCDLVDKGIKSIAVIHDSFGTHAGRTLDLRNSLKGQMVEMYEHTNALASLLEVHEERWKVDTGIKVPEQGTFNVREILDSDYCFA